MTRFNLLLLAVQVRTSTDRTGCTNFFREKMHFLRAGLDKRFDTDEAAYPAATRHGDVIVLHQSTQRGKSGVFALCLNIRENQREEQKSGKTATEKEKSPYRLQGCNSKGGEKTVYLTKRQSVL